jgi:hypothetical protein
MLFLLESELFEPGTSVYRQQEKKNQGADDPGWMIPDEGDT